MARFLCLTILATLAVFSQAKDVRKRIGDRCETNAECQASLGAGGNCTEPANGCYQVTGKHCACANRYREADGDCHLSRSFGDPCESDANCNTLEAVCGDNTEGGENPKSCQCETGSHFSEEINMCLKPIRFNKDQCRYAAECQFFFGKMSQCSYNYNSVYTYRSYNDRREMKCMCTYGHHFVDGKCWRSSNFGRICSSNAQCITKNSHCNEIRNRNVTEQFLNRIFSSNYGGAYNYNYRYGGYSSSSDNSYISDTVKTCQCPQDSIYYEPYDECLRPSILNDSCTFSGQCQFTMGLYSSCLLPEGKVNATGTCVCNKEYFYHKGRCYKETAVGGYCNVHEECVKNKVASVCDNHRCKSLYETKSSKYTSDDKK